MSFDSDEKSVSTSHAREVWLITSPTTTYRYTPSELPVVFSAQTYTPIPGARSEVAGAGGDPPEMVLTLPMSNAFVQANAFGMPPQDLHLTVTRIQDGGAALVWWDGEITGFAIAGDECKVRSPSALADALDTSIPSAYVQRACNHMLYDAFCTQDRTTALNKKVTTASVVNGRTITVASIGTQDGHMKGGEIVRTADGDRRLIVDQVGTVLTINAPFRALVGGDAVELYRGCKHTLADCIATFNNAVNFGGHPHVPQVNPFVGDIRGNPFL